MLNRKGQQYLVERLEHGTCLCPECVVKHILVLSAERKLVCAVTGKEHAFFSRTKRIALATPDVVPFGFCQCCSPRQPLEMREHDRRIFCHRKPDKEYVRVGDSERFVQARQGQVGDIRDRLLDGTLEIGGNGLPV